MLINEQNFISIIVMGLLICLIGITQGCTGQAYEFKIGFGQYSESKETRTYVKEAKHERPL